MTSAIPFAGATPGDKPASERTPPAPADAGNHLRRLARRTASQTNANTHSAIPTGISVNSQNDMVNP